MPSVEPGLDFVRKVKESTEVTRTVSVTISEFSKEIDDLDNKKEAIEGPKFKVGEREFSINIYPEDSDYNPSIGVYLNNQSKEKIKASYIFNHESGVKVNFTNQEIDVGHDYGEDEFLSHVAYKKWAEDHGDVFKVEAEITLHVDEAEWETIPRNRYVLFFFYFF